MKSWRNVGKLTLEAAVFGIGFVMLARVLGFQSPWLWLQAMFFFLGLAKTAQPLFMLRMPSAIRAVSPQAAASRRHDWLGVRRFGEFLRNSPNRHLNRSVYLTKGRRNFADLSRQLESSEAIHFWAAVLFTPYIAYIGFKGYIAETVLFLVIQVVFNIYPVLHLRLVRARLSHLLGEDKRRVMVPSLPN
ncbi:glycosyl-4,4'-diaponeurosporenoate acyltransferase CrtO family protein [Dyella flagellata]|nr:hypothetical protein [Dyella flagellata]